MYVDTNGNPLMTVSMSRWKELGALHSPKGIRENPCPDLAKTEFFLDPPDAANSHSVSPVY